MALALRAVVWPICKPRSRRSARRSRMWSDSVLDLLGPAAQLTPGALTLVGLVILMQIKGQLKDISERLSTVEGDLESMNVRLAVLETWVKDLRRGRK